MALTYTVGVSAIHCVFSLWLDQNKDLRISVLKLLAFQSYKSIYRSSKNKWQASTHSNICQHNKPFWTVHRTVLFSWAEHLNWNVISISIYVHSFKKITKHWRNIVINLSSPNTSHYCWIMWLGRGTQPQDFIYKCFMLFIFYYFIKNYYASP